MSNTVYADKEKPWMEVRYRKNKRDKFKEDEWTFFVQNIPEGVSRTMLWKAFQPYGRVSDAYVAKKLDAGKNHFGFVRFKGLSNVNEMLSKMKFINIMEARLTVTLAKYDKSHNKIVYPPEIITGKFWKPRNFQEKEEATNNTRCNDPKQVGFANVQAGYSYKDAVKNVGQSSVTNMKNIIVDGVGQGYPLHCVGRSVVGTTTNTETINSVKKVLRREGYADVGVSYIGGLRVLITFHDKSEASNFITTRQDVWASLFEEINIWHGEHLPFDRLTRIKIYGVPLQIRDNKLYDQIAGLFGRVITKSEFSWMNSNNSEGSCTIVTNQGSRIEEEINVVWKNQNFPVWVSEEQFSWVPDFGDEEVNGGSGCHDKPVKAMVQDEMEEGEFRRDPSPELHQNDRNMDGKQSDTLESHMQSNHSPVKSTDDSIPVEAERIALDNEETHAEGNNNDALHGNVKKTVDAESLYGNIKISFPISNLNTFSAGSPKQSHNQVDTDLSPTSTRLENKSKRKRANRRQSRCSTARLKNSNWVIETTTSASPLSRKRLRLEEEHGPVSCPIPDKNADPPFPFGHLFDLNNPADSSPEGTTLVNDTPDVEDDMPTPCPINIANEDDDESDPASTEFNLAMETNATMDIGSMAGIELQGYTDQVIANIEGVVPINSRQ